MATSIDIGKPVSIQIFFIIIIIKKDWQCKAGRGRLTPYQSEDPSHTLPTYRGKDEKWFNVSFPIEEKKSLITFAFRSSEA